MHAWGVGQLPGALFHVVSRLQKSGIHALSLPPGILIVCRRDTGCNLGVRGVLAVVASALRLRNFKPRCRGQEIALICRGRTRLSHCELFADIYFANSAE